MVRCTSRATHVMPIMLYPLAYYKSMILSLAGIVGFGCNKTLHTYVCMLIGRDGFLIVGVNLGLLLLAGALCTTVEGGIMHIQ